MIRALVLLLAVVPLLAQAQPRIIKGGGTFRTGPRIMGEPSFAFQLDALEQDEVSRPGWPVTTTRASTRMCLAGSEWKTLPANTACISTWGLASCGPGTNYWANSTDPTTWPVSGCGTVSASGGGWYTLDDPTGSGKCGRRVILADAAATTGSYTLTCGLRAGSLADATLLITSTGGTVASGECVVTSLGAAEGRYSCTATVSGTPTNVQGHVLVGALSSATGTVQVNQCQLEKAPTPGPRHDCGATACSWAADVHRIVEGVDQWPTATWEIRLQFTPLHSTVASGGWFLLDTRVPDGTSGLRLYVWTDGSVRAVVDDGPNAVPVATGPLSWVGCDPTSATCVPYEIVIRDTGGTLSIQRVGSPAGSVSTAINPVNGTTASLGSDYLGTNPVQGFVRLVRVSE